MSIMAGSDQLDPIEKASIDELRALQLVRLRGALTRAYEHVAHFRKAFDAAGVHPNDLRTFADLVRFPFTAKDDLRQNYPFGMFAVPMDDIVRIHASSGTTGQPTVVGYGAGFLPLQPGAHRQSRAKLGRPEPQSLSGIQSRDCGRSGRVRMKV